MGMLQDIFGTGNSAYKGSYDAYQSAIDQGRTTDTGQRIFGGILGGPIGWYEAATGKKNESFLGGGTYGLSQIVGDVPAYAEMNDKDVFDSMSDQDWDVFNKGNDKDRAQFVAKRKAEIAPQLAARKKAEADRLEAEQNQKDFDTKRKDIIAKVTAFANEMNMPVSELLQKDEFAQALRDTTYAGASRQSSNAGFGPGGISAANADQETKRALLGYQMQRQAAGQNALQGAFSDISGMAGEAENARRYEQGLNLQLQQASEAMRQRQYAEGLAKQQATFGMIGGIAGGIYGGPTGAAMGQQLGASIGGSSYGSYKPQGYTYPNINGRGSGSTGLSTNKYGGNY